MGKVSAMMQRLLQRLARELQSSRPSSWAGPPSDVTPTAAYYTCYSSVDYLYSQLTTPGLTSYLSDIDGKGVNWTNCLSSKSLQVKRSHQFELFRLLNLHSRNPSFTSIILLLQPARLSSVEVTTNVI